MSRLAGFYRDRFNLIVASTIVFLACLAWLNRFIQDDAFVSFRYAQNLVNGYGLVFNIGERVEGYTNFLWTMLIAAGLYLDIDPVAFSMGLGLTFFVISLIFTYKTSFLLLGSREAALLTIILLGANYTFSAYATGGLETQLQACLFVVTVYLLLRSLRSSDWSFRALIALSLLLSASLLTRLDSAVLAAVVCAVVLLSVLRLKTKPRGRLWRLLAFSLPALILVGGWLAWKLSFYGTVIPNSFYAKQYPSLTAAIISGTFFLIYFSLSYLLILLAPLGVHALRQQAGRCSISKMVLLMLILLWSLYIALIGGDFMEFRFLVPILPFLFVSLAWLAVVFVRRRMAQVAVVALVLLGSLVHSATFGVFDSNMRVETIAQLYGHVKADGENWSGLGKTLGRALDYSSTVTIATTAVGAVPYYSGLNTVDMLGLNEPWLARNGESVGFKPGHLRMASLDYLARRGVNLVVGQMKAKSCLEGSNTTYTSADVKNLIWLEQPAQLPVNSKIIEIQVGSEHRFPALYLTPSPVVDQAIQRYGWKVYPIHQVASDAPI